VVERHPVADLDDPAVDVAADRRDDAARLVARDHRLTAVLQSQRLERRARRRPIELQVAAAHPGCLDLQHHVARAGLGIGKLDQVEGAVPREDHATHHSLLDLGRFSAL
jgi:hypothetical protein